MKRATISCQPNSKGSWELENWKKKSLKEIKICKLMINFIIHKMQLNWPEKKKGLKEDQESKWAKLLAPIYQGRQQKQKNRKA